MHLSVKLNKQSINDYLCVIDYHGYILDWRFWVYFPVIHKVSMVLICVVDVVPLYWISIVWVNIMDEYIFVVFDGTKVWHLCLIFYLYIIDAAEYALLNRRIIQYICYMWYRFVISDLLWYINLWKLLFWVWVWITIDTNRSVMCVITSVIYMGVLIYIDIEWIVCYIHQWYVMGLCIAHDKTSWSCWYHLKSMSVFLYVLS